jgi:hypothetical protein
MKNGSHRPNGMGQPRRDCGSKPRVGARDDDLLWDHSPAAIHQPQRGLRLFMRIDLPHDVRNENTRSATPGFVTQSPWDKRKGER